MPTLLVIKYRQIVEKYGASLHTHLTDAFFTQPAEISIPAP
jgi:hypothetical protein